MIRILVISLLALTSCQALAAHIYGMQSAERIPGRYIVVLKSAPQQPSQSFNTASDISSYQAGKVIHRYQHAVTGVSIEMSDADIEVLAEDPRVAYIEADRTIHITATQSPVDGGLDRIDQRDLPLDNSYVYTRNDSVVNAYIVDTGIRSSHSEFSGRVQSGFTSIIDGVGSEDCNGHGTHVAGIVGGETYGVAKDVNLISVRVLDCFGSGTLSGVLAGIDWITTNHVSPAVVNMSFGGAPSQALDEAIQGSISAGVTYVVAAGNQNTDACTGSPGRIKDVVTVGASTLSDERASFSNWGVCLDLFAPGENILSAGYIDDTDSALKSGTSMSAPFVSGVAALYLAANPAATPAEVSNAVVQSSTKNHMPVMPDFSPNLIAYSLVNSTDKFEKCSGGYEKFSGNMATAGGQVYQPNGSYYKSGQGLHVGKLEAVDNTDFDLNLMKWNGYEWSVVARSIGNGSEEKIKYRGGEGYYKWNINSFRGNGDYSLCLKHP